MAHASHSPPIVSASLLAADWNQLGSEAQRALEAGADWLHIDVMDGHFVPNLSFGAEVVRALRRLLPHAFLDVHLMIEHADHFIQSFAQAGANLISVHVEKRAAHDVDKTLNQIRTLGCQAGLAINPSTPIEAAFDYLDAVDLLLCMTVEPGFGGQSFMMDVLPKMEVAAKEIQSRKQHILIEADGGITPEISPLCLHTGAHVLVAGTALFKAESAVSMKKTIRLLKSPMH